MIRRLDVWPGVRGLGAAAITLVVAAMLPPANRLDLLAALLFTTAGIYLGFGITDGRRGPQAAEFVGFLAYGALGLAGLWITPLALAAGWLLHPLWDLAHHGGLLRADVREWVIPFCLVYDVLVGVAVLAWWWPA